MKRYRFVNVRSESLGTDYSDVREDAEGPYVLWEDAHEETLRAARYADECASLIERLERAGLIFDQYDAAGQQLETRRMVDALRPFLAVPDVIGQETQ
jgi:hypothetical protein